MTTSRFDLRFAANVGLALTIPLLLLELVVNTADRTSLSPQYFIDVMVLFVIIWSLPTAFVALLGRLTNEGVRGTAMSILGYTVMILLACFWVALIVDQWPCFIGGPNCD